MSKYIPWTQEMCNEVVHIEPYAPEFILERFKTQDLYTLIEEKDATLALFTDDLQNHEYENVALQAQRDVYQAELEKFQNTITHLRTRYVPHARNPGKDNIIIIVRKHTTSTNDKYHGLSHYVVRIQRR